MKLLRGTANSARTLSTNPSNSSCTTSARASQFSTMPADFRPGEAKVDRHGDNARQRSRGVYFQPFQAIIGEHADAIAFAETNAGKRIGKSAGAAMPKPKRHFAVKVAGANLIGEEPRMKRKHLANMRQLDHFGHPRTIRPLRILSLRSENTNGTWARVVSLIVTSAQGQNAKNSH